MLTFLICSGHLQAPHSPVHVHEEVQPCKYLSLLGLLLTKSVMLMPATLDVQGDGDSFLRDVILSLQDKSEVFTEWFTFGLHLNLDVNELEAVEMASKTMDTRYGIRQVLSKWRRRFPQAATWDTIIDALKNIGAVRLAQELKKERQHPPSPSHV